MAKKPRWGLIILGIVLFVVVVGIAIIGTVAYIAATQFSLQTSTTGDPEGEFAKLEARFAGQTPLLEMPDGGGEPVIHREKRTPSTAQLTSLHILAWDPRQKQLARFTMPFWLVRLGGRRPLEFRASEGIFSATELNLTGEDIERHGPGLIARFERDGQRVMVWAE